jgi:hypothetical protein
MAIQHETGAYNPTTTNTLNRGLTKGKKRETETDQGPNSTYRTLILLKQHGRLAAAREVSPEKQSKLAKLGKACDIPVTSWP